MAKSLTGFQVISFENRLQREAAGLIEKHGARVIVAPALQEIPVVEGRETKGFFEALFTGAVDALILLTGVGTTLLIRAAFKERSRAEVLERLASVTLISRGPKPTAALKPFGLRPALTAPEPNTWRELVALLDRELLLREKRIYIQEYGTTNLELLAALTARGARIRGLKLYELGLAADTGPLKTAILKIVRAQAHVALFTSALQIEGVLSVAQGIGLSSAVRRSLNSELVVASVGPMTSAALARHGVTADIVPGHPKLGHLVLAVARRAPSLLAEKRARHADPTIRVPARALVGK